MKFRSFIWISGLALVILAVVQYYFISETFKTKQEQFDSKYSNMAKLGLFEFENRYFDVIEDSIFNLLDDYTYFSIHDAGFAKPAGGGDSLYSVIFNEFDFQLNRKKTRDLYLKEYFALSGSDTVFETSSFLRELTILSYGEERVLVPDSTYNSDELLANGYLVNSYVVERNYFRIRYDFFISFPQRTEQITQEMTLTITLSFITLVIVFGVFFMTLRNLLIQKRLSDLKTDFINNMTHELKTPLSTISVASSSLAMNKGNLSRERIVEISEVIKKQNKHLSRLIDRILDITIWEKDQIRVERKPRDIARFISEIAEDFKATNAGTTIEMNMEEGLSGKEFLIDEVHMTTVINNLLSNARKYGGTPPRIELSVSCNPHLVIHVKDNGKGIPTEERKHLFEKFFRGRETKKNAIRGLGLGLYYVKQIVEAHQGWIRLESSDETGSLFIIEIPKR